MQPNKDDLDRLGHNRLVHAYFDVDLDVLWTIVRDELAPLVGELEEIVENETGKLQQGKLF